MARAGIIATTRLRDADNALLKLADKRGGPALPQQRTARLREADMQATADYPTASFSASDFEFSGDNVAAVRGELRLRGWGRSVELRALRFGCHTHPELQREVCGGDFEGELRRSDFGAGWGVPFVSNRVHLRVQVEGIRQ